MKKRMFFIIVIFFSLLLLINGIIAEKIEVQVKTNYNPGEEVTFKLLLYDDQNILITEPVEYEIQNFYTETFKKDVLISGESATFVLPEHALRGRWAIIARAHGVETKQLFTVMELQKAKITLDEQSLIITNVGNVPYTKPLSIMIGDHEETALVPLGISETKTIKLTAPDGTYDVYVSDGTKENTLEFKGVPLTGNVIGLEKFTEGEFFKKYPLLTLFGIVLVCATIAIFVIRVVKKK